MANPDQGAERPEVRLSYARGPHGNWQHLWHRNSLLLAAFVAFVPLAGYAETTSASRLIGQALSPSEVVIFDEGVGFYVLRLGDELKGGKLVFIGNDSVVITHDGIEETLPVAAVPRPWPAVTKPLMPQVDPVLAPARPSAIVPFTISAPPSGSPPLVMSVLVPGTIAIKPPGGSAATGDEAMIAVTPVLPLAPGVPFMVAAPAFGAPPMVMSVPGLGTVAVTPPRAPAPEVLIAVTPPPPIPSPTPALAVRLARAEIDRGLGDLCALDASVAFELASRGGFRVAELKKGSFLEHMGLRAGDILLSVDGRPLRNAADASKTYNWVRIADHFVVDLVRNGRPITVRFEIDG
jgi:hypothetical protein